MRVNMDSSVVSDPRFKMLAKLLGVTWREVIGACFLVWLSCYERRSERLTVAEVDIASEIDGFAEAAATIGLAHFEANGSADSTEREKLLRVVVVHGVDARIEFLNKQKAKAVRGGIRSGKARHNLNGRKKNGSEAKPEPNGSAVAQATAEAYSPALTLTPAPALTPAQEEKTPLPPAKPGGDARSIFDSLTDACGVDPTIARVNRTLTTTANELAAANPPYTADEVREFGKRFWEFCPTEKDKRSRPTPAMVARWIGLLRTGKRSSSRRKQPPATPPVQTAGEIDAIRKQLSTVLKKPPTAKE